MTVACQCRSLEHVWWHVRLLYVLTGLLVVIYGCSVTWMLTTRVMDTDCVIRDQRHGLSTDHADLVDRENPDINRRVRRSNPRRRSSPAFYRDGNSNGRTVDADEWVWMSTYSKIPVSI